MKTALDLLRDVALAVLIALVLAALLAEWAADEPAIDHLGTGSTE